MFTALRTSIHCGGCRAAPFDPICLPESRGEVAVAVCKVFVKDGNPGTVEFPEIPSGETMVGA